MADDVKDLEVYFDGGNIKPSVVRISDLGQLLSDFEKSILEIVSIRNPEIDLKTPLITLGDVREGSLELVARTAYRTIVIPAYILVSTAISTQDYTSLPIKSIESLKAIRTFTKKYNCTGYLKLDGETIAEINRHTVIGETATRRRSETTIHGEVVRIGGETPKVKLNLLGGESINIEIPKEIARKLGEALYGLVALEGVAKWNPETYEITDFKVKDVKEIKNKPYSESFTKIAEIYSKHLDLDHFEEI